MRSVPILLALLVLLSGCSMLDTFQSGGSEDGGAQSTTETPSATVGSGTPTEQTPSGNGDDTATQTRSTTTTTETPPRYTERLQPSQHLPYSSELPVSGYLRIDEISDSEANRPAILTDASRTFERTEQANKSGPDRIVTQLIVYRSSTAAERGVSELVSNLSVTRSEFTYDNTVLDVPVMQAQFESSDQTMTTLSIVRYGNAVVVVEIHDESHFHRELSQDITRILLTKLHAAE